MPRNGARCHGAARDSAERGLGMRSRARRAARCIATVGGLGRVPWGPGTWGSAVGLLLGVPAARTLSRPLSLPALLVSFVVCAVICGWAEEQLGEHDPAAVILDEVWGMASIIIAVPRVASSCLWLLVAFGLFRLFDTSKPFPLKRLARLPAGWGIMADDGGAAAYTILLLLMARLAG